MFRFADLDASRERGMTFDEYQTDGMAFYADFAEGMADVLETAIADQRKLRFQNI